MAQLIGLDKTTKFIGEEIIDIVFEYDPNNSQKCKSINLIFHYGFIKINAAPCFGIYSHFTNLDELTLCKNKIFNYIEDTTMYYTIGNSSIYRFIISLEHKSINYVFSMKTERHININGIIMLDGMIMISSEYSLSQT